MSQAVLDPNHVADKELKKGWPYNRGGGAKLLTKRQAIFAALLLAFTILPPVLARTTELLPGDRALILATAVCYALMALSLNVLLGYAGQISLGHGAFLGLGAFVSGTITINYYLPLWMALVGAAIVGGLFALVIGLPALRLRGLYLAVATIGFAFMMEESLFRWEPFAGGSGGLELPRPRIAGFRFLEHADYLVICLIVLLGFWLLDQNMIRTKIGRAFHAIRSNESVAQGFGINVSAYKLLAFVLAGALAGVAGALYGHMIGFVNSESFAFKSQPNFSLLLVVIVVVGGLGSRVGVAVAAIFYALIPHILRPLEGWELIVGAVALIDVMTRHPGGVAGAVRDRREKRAARKARAAEANDEEEDDALPKLPDLPRPSGLPERTALAEGTPLLQIEDVSVSFGGLKALDGAFLEVPEGKIVGLIGPNGAGKTTLFNTVSGFVQPEKASIRYRGREISHLPPHERSGLGIGRTFQHIGLAKDLSVNENFLLAQHNVAHYGLVPALLMTPGAGGVEEELVERADQAIEALGFERFTETPVKNLLARPAAHRRAGLRARHRPRPVTAR